MKRLLFTALLWTVALHAQGRMGAVHSSPPARAGSGAGHYSAPASAVYGRYALRPMPVTRPQAPGRRVAPAVSRASFNTFAGQRSFNRNFNRNVSFNRNFNHNFDRFHHRRHFRSAHPFFFSRFNNCLNGSLFCNNLFGYPYYPLFPEDYSAPAPPAPDPYASANQVALSYEIERLSREIDDMRDEERQREQKQNEDEMTENQSGASARRPAEPAEPPKTLVFRDGHQVLVENYAVSGNTMWIIGKDKVQKISMNDVDTDATQRANSDTDLRLRH